MNDKNRMELAYFRYGVISPLLAASDEFSLKQRLQEQAAKLWTLPDGRLRQVAWGTIEKWLHRYRRGGLPALQDHPRKDLGSYREIPPPLAQAMDQILRDHPQLTTANILQLLLDQGHLQPHKPSKSTLYRYLRSHRPLQAQPTQERRSFEAPYAGALWQTDFMYGPFIPCQGADGRYRSLQTYLIAILDDHSRLLCHAQFYFHQDLASYLHTLKTACQKRGLPEKLYCDNGQVFLSSQVKRIAAELGILILHTSVRDAAAKGKIERVLQTLQSSFLNPLMALQKPKTLDELNQKLWRWIEQEYNLRHHSAIAASPMHRYLQTAYKLRLLPQDERQDQMFLLEDQRKVKKDGTFSLQNQRFETDWTLAGKTIVIRYDPVDPKRVFVTYDQHSFGLANPLDPQSNYRRPRTKKGTNP